jgi:cytoskeletal protein RodZ
MIDDGLTVGQYLKKRREEKEVSLKHVAEITRIGVPYLQALERDEFHRLPGECFARGFLWNYARVIEVDPDEVMAAYRSQTGADRKQVLGGACGPPVSNSFSRKVRNHVFDFVSTILGATPSFSINKIVLPPKD